MTNQQTVIGAWQNQLDQWVHLGKEAGDQFGDHGGAATVSAPSGGFEQERWYYLTTVRASGSCSLYIDGALMKEAVGMPPAGMAYVVVAYVVTVHIVLAHIVMACIVMGYISYRYGLHRGMPPAGPGTNPVMLGVKRDMEYPWIGEIDDVAFWRRGLTSDEIEELYQTSQHPLGESGSSGS